MDINVKKSLEKIDDLEIGLEIVNKPKLTEIIMNGIRHLILIGVSLITFFPFLWMISSALKTKDEVFNFPPVLIPKVPQWSNFTQVFKEAPFEVYLGNSLFVASIEVIFQVISAAMIAYALTQFKFKGKKVLFAIIMGTYMLPSAVTYIPCYMILADLNLIDTLAGLVISNLANVFGIFLIRQSFLQVDRSLVEAARMDGASHLKILLKIMFPLTKPTFITFGLISFVTYYNEYMYPSLITKSPENFLVSVRLRQLFIQWGA